MKYMHEYTQMHKSADTAYTHKVICFDSVSVQWEQTIRPGPKYKLHCRVGDKGHHTNLVWYSHTHTPTWKARLLNIFLFVIILHIFNPWRSNRSHTLYLLLTVNQFSVNTSRSPSFLTDKGWKMTRTPIPMHLFVSMWMNSRPCMRHTLILSQKCHENCCFSWEWGDEQKFRKVKCQACKGNVYIETVFEVHTRSVWMCTVFTPWEHPSVPCTPAPFEFWKQRWQLDCGSREVTAGLTFIDRQFVLFA